MTATTLTTAERTQFFALLGELRGLHGAALCQALRCAKRVPYTFFHWMGDRSERLHGRRFPGSAAFLRWEDDFWNQALHSEREW